MALIEFENILVGRLTKIRLLVNEKNCVALIKENGTQS